MRRTRRFVHFLTEVLAFLAILAFLLAFTWGFWIDGDEGPDRVFTVMAAAGFIFGGLSFLIEYLFTLYRRNHARRRKHEHRRAAESKEFS